MKKAFAVILMTVACFVGVRSVFSAPKRGSGVYPTVQDALKAGPDFRIQGEYEGAVGGAGGGKIGVQVIALGKGCFQAVFLPGGLPGAGWDEKTKILCDGKLQGGKVVFVPAKGVRKYMAKEPGQFSAVEKFPPEGQKAYTAVLAGGALTGKTDTGKVIKAGKVLRKSPTLGAGPPAGAVVLLAYRPGKAPSLDEWTNARWRTFPQGFMRNQRSGSNQTRRQFEGPWRLHVEFMSPFQPAARGQGRGNSGVFPPGGREVQVLDSFGLEGMANECGGIYKTHRPKVNMCLPPLSWQTYDITYHPAGSAEDGKKGTPAYYQIVHNGVVIHEKMILGGGRKGGLSFQDHGNPVSYRNVWIIKTKAGAEEPKSAKVADRPKPAPAPKSDLDGLTLKETMALARKKAKAGQYDYIMDNMLSRECVNDLIGKYGKDKWRAKFLKDKLESLPYYFGWLKKPLIKKFGGKTILTGGPNCHAEFVKVGNRYLIVDFGQRLTSM